MSDVPNIPIFPRAGNRMAAVNPALVRTVETQASGGCKIIFDRDHELMVDASLYEVMRALWGSSPMAQIKELAPLAEP
jgi:hypothetical protein